MGFPFKIPFRETTKGCHLWNPHNQRFEKINPFVGLSNKCVDVRSTKMHLWVAGKGYGIAMDVL